MNKKFYLFLIYCLSQLCVLGQQNNNINDEFEGESILLLAQQWYEQALSFPATSEAATQTAGLARKRYIQFIALKPELSSLSKAQYELAQCYLIEGAPLLAKEYFLACISSGAEDEWGQQAIYEIAKIDEAEFGFEKALGWYEQLLKKSINPELKALVLLKLAQHAQEQNDIEQATQLYLDFLTEIKQQDSEKIAGISTLEATVIALTNLAQIYFLQGKTSTADTRQDSFSKAQDYYNQLLSFELTAEQKSTALFQQAIIEKSLDNIDNYHAKLLAITEDESLKNWHEQAYLKLLVSYFEQGENDVVLDTLSYLAKSTIIQGLATEIYWLGANAAQRTNQFDLASEYFDKIQKLRNGTDSSSLNKIAIDYQDLLLSHQRAQDKTAESLTKKIDKFLYEYQSDIGNHYYQMAIWLKAEQLLSLADYPQALFYYESIKPEFLNVEYQSKYGNQLTNIFIQAKAYDKAVEILTQTLNNPGLSEDKVMQSLIKRAACYESLKQDHLAIADYEQVFKYRSNINLFAHAKYRLAEILANKSLPKRSINTYLGLLEQVPTLDNNQQAFIYSKLGYLYQLINELDTSEQYYNKCLSLNIDKYFPLANQALMEIYFSQQATTKLSDLIENIWAYNQKIIDDAALIAPLETTKEESSVVAEVPEPIVQEAIIIKKPINIPRTILIWVATRHYIGLDYAKSQLFLHQLYKDATFSDSELLLYRYKATAEFEINDLSAAQATINLWLAESISSYEKAQAQLLESKILYQQKRYESATTKLEALMEQNPQGALLANIQYELAKNYSELGQADKAIQYLILIIEFNTEITYGLRKRILTDLVPLLKGAKKAKELDYYQNQLNQISQDSHEK